MRSLYRPGATVTFRDGHAREPRELYGRAAPASLHHSAEFEGIRRYRFSQPAKEDQPVVKGSVGLFELLELLA